MEYKAASAHRAIYRKPFRTCFTSYNKAGDHTPLCSVAWRDRQLIATVSCSLMASWWRPDVHKSYVLLSLKEPFTRSFLACKHSAHTSVLTIDTTKNYIIPCHRKNWNFNLNAMFSSSHGYHAPRWGTEDHVYWLASLRKRMGCDIYCSDMSLSKCRRRACRNVCEPIRRCCF